MADRVGIDTGTDAQVATQEKTEGGQTIHVQRFAQDWDALDFGGAAPNALDSVNVAGSESGDILCEGKSLIQVTIEYSANDVTAPFWIVRKDHNGTVVGRQYPVKLTPANTGEQDDIRETGYFHGEGIDMDVGGAKNFRVVLADTPSNSGSVSVWAKAV